MSNPQDIPRCPPSPTTIRSSAVGGETPAWPLHMAANPQYINGPSPSQHYFHNKRFSPPVPGRPGTAEAAAAATAPTTAPLEQAETLPTGARLSPSPPPAHSEPFTFFQNEKSRSPSPPPIDGIGVALPTTSPHQGNSFEGSHTQYEEYPTFPAYPEKAAHYPGWGEKSIFTGVHGWEIPRAPSGPMIQNPTLLSWRNGFERLYQSWVDNWWLWELLSWTISAVCMGIIALILVIADGKAVGNVDVTLNAIISVLSGIAKAALLLPTAEALGQLKWSWFWRGTKKVQDFETFDNASRGPWGSLVMLWRTRGMTFATFGAIIVIVAVALDPFFQQLVTFPQKWVPTHENGTLPQVIRYPASTANQTQDGNTIYEPDPIMKAFVVPYIFGNELEPQIPWKCPTSNCTWEAYETLAVCSACQDVSHLLTWDCLERPLDWLSNVTDMFNLTDVPTANTCGFWLNATSKNPVLMSGFIGTPNPEEAGLEALESRIFPLFDTRPLYDPDVNELKTYWGGSINFRDTAFPFFDFIAANTPGGSPEVYNNATPKAQECVLSWCVKQYSARLYLGNLTQDLHRNFQPEGPTVDAWTSNDVDGPMYTKNFSFKVPGNDFDFEVSNATIFDTASLIAWLFPMTVTGNRQHRTIYRYPALFTQPFTRDLWSNAWDTDIAKHIDGLARLMSNVMMTSFEGTREVMGTAWDNEVYVHVRWKWLILPFGVLFFSLVFLLATIFKADHEKAEVGIWKTSALATLMNGFRGDVRQRMGRSSHMGDVRAHAKEVTMKLTYDKKGYRLSGLPGATWAQHSPASSHSHSARGGKNWI